MARISDVEPVRAVRDDGRSGGDAELKGLKHGPEDSYSGRSLPTSERREALAPPGTGVWGRRGRVRATEGALRDSLKGCAGGEPKL